MSYRTDTDNFLHTNPSLYLAFNGDDDTSMGQFMYGLLERYAPGREVLDIGSGPGREVAYLNGNGYRAVGLDNSEAMLEWSRDRYPGSDFLYGNQTDFELGRQFDAVTCVGSTFLYNFTNVSIRASLSGFRRHLREGGLLYLDMRNAAFFLTPEGQRWLTEDLVEQQEAEGVRIQLRTRFRINPAEQLLEREYSWTIGDRPPLVEHLQHRLLFPQELAAYLEASGFAVLELFDQPAPHISSFEHAEDGSLLFGRELTGRRMQVIARAV